MFEGLRTSVAVGVSLIVGAGVLAVPTLERLAEESEAGALVVLAVGLAAMCAVAML